MIGESIWNTYKRWPVYSKFFDNLGPIPHHMHQNQEQAAKLGREGKPESYYFPPQLNWTGNNFPYTFMGFEPGTTKESDVRRCLEQLGTRATTGSSTCRRPIASSPAPAGSSRPASCTRRDRS